MSTYFGLLFEYDNITNKYVVKDVSPTSYFYEELYKNMIGQPIKNCSILQLYDKSKYKYQIGRMLTEQNGDYIFSDTSPKEFFIFSLQETDHGGDFHTSFLSRFLAHSKFGEKTFVVGYDAKNKWYSIIVKGDSGISSRNVYRFQPSVIGGKSNGELLEYSHGLFRQNQRGITKNLKTHTIGEVLNLMIKYKIIIHSALCYPPLTVEEKELQFEVSYNEQLVKLFGEEGSIAFKKHLYENNIMQVFELPIYEYSLLLERDKNIQQQLINMKRSEFKDAYIRGKDTSETNGIVKKLMILLEKDKLVNKTIIAIQAKVKAEFESHALLPRSYVCANAASLEEIKTKLNEQLNKITKKPIDLGEDEIKLAAFRKITTDVTTQIADTIAFNSYKNKLYGVINKGGGSRKKSKTTRKKRKTTRKKSKTTRKKSIKHKGSKRKSKKRKKMKTSK